MFEESKHPRDKDGKFTTKNAVNQRSLEVLKKEQEITLPKNNVKVAKPVLTYAEKRQIESNALQQLSQHLTILESDGLIRLKVYTYNSIALVSIDSLYDITILKVTKNE